MELPLHAGHAIRLKLLTIGFSVSAAARALRVDRSHLSNVINGHAGISPYMALKLAAALGGSAEQWLQLQAEFELAILRKKKAVNINNIQRLE
jgi:antitoxin HigA-1